MVDKRQLICLELILVLNNAEVVSVTFEKVYCRVDFLNLVHIFDLDDEHEAVDVDGLFAEDVGLCVVWGGGLLVDKEYLFGFLLAFLVVPVH